MKVYEQLSLEQLEKHREVLLWLLGSVDLELAKRRGTGPVGGPVTMAEDQQ